ncbi:hypothetical protein TSTA_047310 [Talaromyces stipitatus ATCC 10500]|uniref:Uncharacterized protein n=1 Tax=Talaromyces stipitatus (strain ATCC 10500 / CBS 375.48 / QM 6759 / NRRL 1006) TaxID=441959 RepID=B8MKC5_TALSN|nr:uncharacterized protein TSTA_047310 [Talaromyces stipitatus ATCC 10500]EED15280.1 hypothetical protein TSTA_047310 [Talaromyces stipitatus ATCC 10500]
MSAYCCIPINIKHRGKKNSKSTKDTTSEKPKMAIWNFFLGSTPNRQQRKQPPRRSQAQQRAAAREREGSPPSYGSARHEVRSGDIQTKNSTTPGPPRNGGAVSTPIVTEGEDARINSRYQPYVESAPGSSVSMEFQYDTPSTPSSESKGTLADAFASEEEEQEKNMQNKEAFAAPLTIHRSIINGRKVADYTGTEDSFINVSSAGRVYMHGRDGDIIVDDSGVRLNSYGNKAKGKQSKDKELGSNESNGPYGATRNINMGTIIDNVEESGLLFRGRTFQAHPDGTREEIEDNLHNCGTTNFNSGTIYHNVARDAVVLTGSTIYGDMDFSRGGAEPMTLNLATAALEHPTLEAVILSQTATRICVEVSSMAMGALAKS